MKKIFWLIILSILLSSCVTQKRCNLKFPVSRDSLVVVETTIVEKIRDTIIYLPADNSSATIHLKADSTGIIIQSIETTSGTNLAPPNIKLKNNTIYVDCKVDSMAIYFHLKDRLTVRSKTETVTKTHIEHVNYLTSWQWFQVWLGRLLLLFLLLILIFLIIKQLPKFKKF